MSSIIYVDISKRFNKKEEGKKHLSRQIDKEKRDINSTKRKKQRQSPELNKLIDCTSLKTRKKRRKDDPYSVILYHILKMEA